MPESLVTERKPAVLVVTSTVVRGAVGGRAASFALERLGFPVWSIQTVTLPWHPGHGPAGRIIPDQAAFERLVDDLSGAPWLGEIGGILTGYMGAPWQPAIVARLIDAVRARRPDVLYLCDPIMGDAGKLYVPPETAAAIRDQLAPRADILTPNLTELSFLAGTYPAVPTDIAAAAGALAAPRVAVTSAGGDAGWTETALMSHGRRLLAAHPLVAGRVPNGTGDLFAGLLLGRLLEGRSEADALGLATASVFELLGAALARGDDELPIAACQDRLVSPLERVAITTR